MTISIDVSGLTALARRQGSNSAKVHADAAAVIAKGAYDVQRLAQQLAPHRTGALARSIGIDFSDDGLTAVIGPEVGYDTYVEYGTNDTPAEPYMEPAGDAVLPEVSAALLAIARRAAK